MTQKTLAEYRNAIGSSGFTIYSHIEVGDQNLWLPPLSLQELLNQGMVGLVLRDAHNQAYKQRTRSKKLKIAACKALGYPVPKTFTKTQPRFIGQQFDVYGQKSLNLQIWNEPISPTRRYAIVDISEDDVIRSIKVVSGQELLLLDKTGKITRKYQAQILIGPKTHELFSTIDTEPLRPHVITNTPIQFSAKPTSDPQTGALLSIDRIFQLLSPLVGMTFKDPGADQDRNRGAALHSLVCRELGYSNYKDNGQFPDVRHQLLEIKLQTSPTIDLGMVLPSSEESLVIPPIGTHSPRHCDIRYAIFYAKTDGKKVTLTHLFITTGADFFTRFRRFEGKVTNGKIQIPLPQNFFSS